jgi:hypothetical protein
MDPPVNGILNPGFTNQQDIGCAVFGMISTLLDEDNADYDPGWPGGWHIGILKEDLGPVKAGTRVGIDSKGDKVTVFASPGAENNYQWKEIYKFRVKLQPMIILEDIEPQRLL